MMEKAIITSQQAKAIQEFRDNKWSDADILYGWYSDGDDFPSKLHESIRSMSLDGLAKSLYVGYEIEQPKFEAGEWVTRTRGRDTRGHHFSEGRTFKVIEAAKNGITVVDENKWYHSTLDIRHASKEEIFWAELGREVGEFRIGDVYVNKQAYINESEDDDDIETFSNWYKDGNFLGLYPTESYKKFNK